MSFFSDKLKEQFSTGMAQEMLWLMTGDKLGNGMTREVFRFYPEPSLVIKFEPESGHFQNVLEYQAWDAIQHTKLAKWFAPCEFISHCGRIMLQKYCEPIPAIKLPAEVPAFFTDLKPCNWGIYKGHPVALDYGKHLMLEKGMTGRMRRAQWT